MAHVTALLDRTSSGTLRGRLLALIEALVAPAAARAEERAGRAAAANGTSFVEAGGIALAIDLVAGSLTKDELG